MRTFSRILTRGRSSSRGRRGRSSIPTPHMSMESVTRPGRAFWWKPPHESVMTTSAAVRLCGTTGSAESPPWPTLPEAAEPVRRGVGGDLGSYGCGGGYGRRAGNPSPPGSPRRSIARPPLILPNQAVGARRLISFGPQAAVARFALPLVSRNADVVGHGGGRGRGGGRAPAMGRSPPWSASARMCSSGGGSRCSESRSPCAGVARGPPAVRRAQPA